MRLHQGHAFDVAAWPTASVLNHLKQLAPPNRFSSRLRLWYVEREWMAQTLRFDLIRNHRDIKQRCRNQFARNYSGLAKVQPARSCKDHGPALIDADVSIAF